MEYGEGEGEIAGRYWLMDYRGRLKYYSGISWTEPLMPPCCGYTLINSRLLFFRFKIIRLYIFSGIED